VGKAYVPIEEEEVNKAVRKMIVKQLKRSAIIAWEGRPRDLYGEILRAEQEGFLPTEEEAREKYTCGTEVLVDPDNPPWGDVQHPGWSSPSHRSDNTNPDVQFADVIAELPHLVEAKAVSLAPPDPLLTPVEGGQAMPDPIVVELLQRPGNMAMREYLTQLSYLGLIQPASVGQKFLSQYEHARFSNTPITTGEFNSLMVSFANLLAGMTALDRRIVDEIRTQNGGDDVAPIPFSVQSASRASTPVSPVTARSRPYLQAMDSEESFAGSVIHTSSSPSRGVEALQQSRSETSLPSDAGSVVRFDMDHG
jgi:hypothetical protein